MCNLGKNVESVLTLVKMELTNCLTVLIRSTKSTLLPFKMAADAPCTVCSHRLTCWALFMWTKCVYNCLCIQIKVWSVAVHLEISTFCSGSQFFETWKSNWWAINLSRINSSQINSSRVKSTQLESNQLNLSQTNSRQIKPTRVKSTQLESNLNNQLESTWVKSNQLESVGYLRNFTHFVWHLITLTLAGKDCLRTDRHLEFYSEGNENTDKLRRILTTFVIHDPELGKLVITAFSECNPQPMLQ